MHIARTLPFLIALVATGTPLLAKSGGHAGHASHAGHHATHSSHVSSGHSRTHTSTRHTWTPNATAVTRDSRGRIARSEQARREFEAQTGYPNGRPGYVVDHIRPLACGGKDAPANMQWQSAADAKAKDKVERKGC